MGIKSAVNLLPLRVSEYQRLRWKISGKVAGETLLEHSRPFSSLRRNHGRILEHNRSGMDWWPPIDPTF